ncbi:hypothetical protein [Mycobacterium asiaticum]|uniref:hypothetical protein n=1 Tax=Mycobacterium asiaticum TaxID=1790 RepID=UPI0039C38239
MPRRHRLATPAPQASSLLNPVVNHARVGMETATSTTARYRLIHSARRASRAGAGQVLLPGIGFVASWAIGLLVAAWIVPTVSLSAAGFIVGVAVFAVPQTILFLPILRLPHRHASLLLGGTGLALTVVALILASALTDALSIDGVAPWLATTVVVWLVTTIGAITVPELLSDDGTGSTAPF